MKKKLVNAPLTICYGAEDVTKKVTGYVGGYVLKDGSFSPEPVHNQEKAIMVAPHLVLDLRLSKVQVSSTEAVAFYQMMGVKPPTYLQLLMLELNLERVNTLLRQVKLGEYGFTDPLCEFWHDGILLPGEQRRCALLSWTDGFVEPTSEIISQSSIHSYFLLDGKALFHHYNSFVVDNVPFQALMVWGGLDLFVAYGSEFLNFLFVRDTKTKKFQFVSRLGQVQYSFLSDELLIIGQTVFQLKEETLCLIHSVGRGDRVRFTQGELFIEHDTQLSYNAPACYETKCYGQDDNGLYTKLLS